MANTMALPKIGVNMEEAVISKWLVKEGDEIKDGDPIMEAETDKSVQEIYAIKGGVIKKLLANEGDTVPCGQDIILFEGGESDEPEAPQQAAPKASNVRTMSLPKIGVNMEEAVISKWLVKEGNEIKDGDPIIEAETDKSTQEIYATDSGVIAELLVNEGDTVPCGQDILVLIDPGAVYIKGSVAADKKEPRHEKPEEKIVVQKTVIAAKQPLADRLRISPLARKTARENNVNIADLKPQIPGGRIVKDDVLRYLNNRAAQPTAAAAMVAEAVRMPMVSQAAGIYEDQTLSRVRKIIARSMLESLTQTAQLTHDFSFDATQMIEYRGVVKQEGEKLGLANITYNDMILFAVSRILPKHKALNAHLYGDTLRCFENVNLGMAVDTPRGLLVPTIFNANHMTLNEISAAAKDLSKQAQEGTIDPDLLTDASFTVSNLGAYRVEHFTPIINPPQTGILGVDNITYRIKMEDGEPVFYPAMGLSLTYDHRALDGAPASLFGKELCEALENFMSMLAK